MLTDILSALQVLAEAISSYQGPDNRRRYVGKRLADACQEIDKILSTGSMILSCFEHGKPLSVETLLSQQRAIDKAMKAFQNQKIQRLLAVHLPTLNRLEVLWEPKSRNIGFLISQWVDGQFTSRAALLRLLHNQGVPIESDTFTYARVARNVNVEDFNNISKIWLLLPFVFLPKKLFVPYLLSKSRGAQIEFFATKQHVQEAENVLNQIRNANDDLRALLATKFELQDIL